MLKFWLSTFLLLTFANAAQAEDYVITLQDGQFSPKELTVPAGQIVKVVVKNLDAKPAEFESSDFDREKMVKPHDQITVSIGPLKAGRYGYFNDFDESATGTIIAQ